jgi:regulatory protein
MEITRTEVVGGGERVRLYLDGEEDPRLELAIDLFMRAGLAAGDSISEARFRALERDNERHRARDAALNLLAHRARSREELRRRLWRKEIPDALIEETLAWLEERGYVDDRAFAESFVRDRLRLRPRGRVGLIQELTKKGVDRDVADAAIAAVMDAENVAEVDLARRSAEAWARKNARVLRNAGKSRDDRQKARRRLYGHLARRGFAPDAVRTAIDSVMRED